MKFNFNICKIKKITMIELSVAFLALIAVGIYYSPFFINKQEAMMAAKIKTDNAVFISKVLEEFAQDKNAKSSQIAQKVADELNILSKNPYDRKSDAYTFEASCKACNSIECNDSLSMIILSTYDKKGDLMARTVIKTQSFVTYVKNNDDK